MDSGEALAVDLHYLWVCATEDLPEIAERWAGANQELYGYAEDRGAFSRQEAVPGATVRGHQLNAMSVGRVYPYFDQLRDELQNIMAESARNVYDTADALIEIMNNYAESDRAAGDRLARQLGSTQDFTLDRSEIYRAE